MNILMLAPEPFFEPRGTPISVYLRIMALGELGHSVTLVTYPLGQDVHLRGLKIVRPPNLFLSRRVKIGPSLMKIPLDLLLLAWAFRELARNSYDLIFSHEEAALLGVILAKIWRKPHVYDMHSSLPQQLENFEFTRSPVVLALFRGIERFILKNSQAVIVICRDLREAVRRLGQRDKTFLLENYIDFPAAAYCQEEVAEKKRGFAPRGEKLILYAGNFEPYQGIPLLLRAARVVEAEARFLLVGGSGRPLTEMKRLAGSLGLSEKVIFLDKVSPSRVSFYIDLADVLVSPRLAGTNTPLKIYSWLKSGKPIVATDLWTHTQTLSREQAILVGPDPQSLARGIEFALKNSEAITRARAAKEWAEREFILPKYLEKMALILEKACSHFQEKG